MRSEKFKLCDMRDDEIASNMWIKHIKHEEHTVEMQRLSISGKTQFVLRILLHISSPVRQKSNSKEFAPLPSNRTAIKRKQVKFDKKKPKKKQKMLSLT